MKKKFAIISIALIGLVIVAFVAHFFAMEGFKKGFPLKTLWTASTPKKEEEKDKKRVDKHSMLVLGSSEFNHGEDTKYHPFRTFLNSDMRPILVGQAYTQSLYHAIALSAIDPELENRKVAIIVSPQWFDDKGVKMDKYTSRFSEANYIAMLLNPSVSLNLKKQMAARTEVLVANSPDMLARIKEYNGVLLEETIHWTNFLVYQGKRIDMEERDGNSVWTAMKTSESKFMTAGIQLDKEPINWDQLDIDAENEGAKTAKKEHYYMNEDIFNKDYRDKVHLRKGYQRDLSYSLSPEYGDIKILLDLCKERKVRPMLIILPVNGYWADLTEFKQERRQDFYKNMRNLAKEYNVEINDLSGDEYTPYFFEDSIHIALKGWVKTNKVIYDFYKAPDYDLTQDEPGKTKH